MNAKLRITSLPRHSAPGLSALDPSVPVLVLQPGGCRFESDRRLSKRPTDLAIPTDKTRESRLRQSTGQISLKLKNVGLNLKREKLIQDTPWGSDDAG
jgi:hypothetical protein